jgi:hypothetical protein
MRRVFSDPLYPWRVSLVATALEAEGIKVHVDGRDIGTGGWAGMSGSPSVWVPDDTDEEMVRVILDRALAEQSEPSSSGSRIWLVWIALALVFAQIVAWALAAWA